MIVVSDTSCITNLITIGAVDLLSSLFGEVIIPPAVERELRRTHPTVPGFIQMRVPANRAFIENSRARSTRAKQRRLRWRKSFGPIGY